jgi:hypothetical protein
MHQSSHLALRKFYSLLIISLWTLLILPYYVYSSDRLINIFSLYNFVCTTITIRVSSKPHGWSNNILVIYVNWRAYVIPLGINIYLKKAVETSKGNLSQTFFVFGYSPSHHVRQGHSPWSCSSMMTSLLSLLFILECTLSTEYFAPNYVCLRSSTLAHARTHTSLLSTQCTLS